ncbi:MAG: SIS domain-containing protein [Solirubrobacteraceae bacterium]
MSEDEPELREGPPWVMEEMIEAQPELAREIARGSAPEVLAQHVREALAAGEPIVICGCGTSEHAAHAIAAILAERAPDARVSARDAFEAQLEPPGEGLLIAISHEGQTAATLAAARHAATHGARSLLITARPQRAPDGVPALATPLVDRSWCHTVAYMSPILLCALSTGLEAEAARTQIERQLAARHRRTVDAAAIASCRRLLLIGSGVDEITAAELALKIEEGAHIPCTPLGVEKVLHGHLTAADAHTGAVLIRFEPAAATIRDARAANVGAALAVLDMPTVQLSTPKLPDRAQALIAGAVALQLLTLELVLARGTNPDLIRREQPLYRRVAEVGGAG